MSVLWPSIGWYCVFRFFVFQQQLHSRSFRGASKSYGLLLSLSGFLGMIVGIFYLGWLAYSAQWWAPALAFIASVIVSGVISGLLRTDGALAATGLAGFIIAPIAGYLMFSTI